MYEGRLATLQRIIRAADLDAVVLVPGHNLVYVTGAHFHLSERLLVGIFPAQGEPVFVLPTLEAGKLTISPPYPMQPFTYSDADGHSGAFASASLVLDASTIGVEGRGIRFAELEALQTAMPNAQFVDADEPLSELRARKNPEEVNALRAAIRISQDALRAVVADVRVGMTERQIANQLIIALYRRGGEGLAFPPMVQSGPNSALAHFWPTDRALGAGDVLQLDFGTIVNGYCSDVTRVFVVGELADSRLQETYEVVLAANEAGRKTIGPGVPCQDVDRAARAVIERAGFGEYFIHRVGHGLGMDVHEPPFLREGNTRLLEPGHVVTVEPSIKLPGLGGFRIEDDVLVTENGAESLTTFPRTLQSVGG